MTKRTRKQRQRTQAAIIEHIEQQVGDTPAVRHLAYTHGAPDKHSGVMLLVDDSILDGDNVVKRYRCTRMFNRVQHDDRWWRLQGQDRATGECVFTPETELT